VNLDGLSTEELERSRASWWDAAFTRLLLDAVPPDSATLIDVGCGVGTAAHALLPARPHLRYLGVDLDAERLERARLTFEGTSYRARVTLRRAAADQLPVPEATAEVVLFVLTLQHLDRPVVALEEAHRALVPDGRVVAVEPDNLGVRFGFDGTLDELSRAFADLCRTARAHDLARGADLAIGPALPHLFERAGLRVAGYHVHAVQTTRHETLGELRARLRAIADTVARHVPDGAADLRTAKAAFAAAVDALGPPSDDARRGWSSHVVPAHLAVGLRPSSP
jgi:SAM-dependent methyltransferase